MRKLLVFAALTLAACGGGGGGGGPATVATPTFSPGGGTYATTQTVAIASATAGAAIHYTVDGSTPTASSTTYSTPLSITTTTNVKAIATAAGMTESAVASATYTLQAGAPTFSPSAGTYATAQSVALACVTPGAAIHYTTDGTTPTVGSTTYTTPIVLPLGATAATTTVKAMAVAGGFLDSTVATATYVIDPVATPAAAPTFSPDGGTFTAAQSVVIATTTSGASIYYTTDGSTPTTASTLYAGPVPVGASLTLKAIAAGGGHSASTVASATFTINLPQAATPTFTPAAGSYTAAQNVTIASTTAGAAIHYTVDGTTPTAASTLYTAPVAVPTSRTLKAIATATGYAPSAVATATYTISTGGGGSFATLCSSFFNKQVGLMTTCFHANPDYVAWILGGEQSFCSAAQKQIDLGQITWNAGQGAACQAAIDALGCEAVFGGGGSSAPAACDAAIVGTVATGGTCYSSDACATGYCGWDLAAGTCPDTCRPFVALGQPCTVSEMCAPGQSCYAPPLGTPVCTTESTAAESPCPCRDGLWCDFTGATRVCKAPLALGASCDASDGQCAGGLVCAGSPATCQAPLALGATCTPPASAGDPEQCGYGYRCDSGTSKCVSWPKLNEPCDVYPVCIASYCDALAATPNCKELLADGATCSATSFGRDCASGFCNPSLKCAPGESAICSPP